MPKVRGLYREFGSCFKEAGLFDDPTKILDYIDEMLMIGKECRGGIHPEPHICYDGERTFEVSKLTKLKNYNEIFIDALFPETYNEILKLLRKGGQNILLEGHNDDEEA